MFVKIRVHMVHRHLVKDHVCLIFKCILNCALNVFSATFVRLRCPDVAGFKVVKAPFVLCTVLFNVTCDVNVSVCCSHAIRTDAEVVSASTYHEISSYFLTSSHVCIAELKLHQALFLSSGPIERSLLSAPQVYPLHALHHTCRHSL